MGEAYVYSDASRITSSFDLIRWHKPRREFILSEFNTLGILMGSVGIIFFLLWYTFYLLQ